MHARPDGMPTAGLVLHPDIGGLRPLFEDMARRLATHGLAVCVDRAVRGSAASRCAASVEARLAHVEGSRRHAADGHARGGRRPARRRGRRRRGSRCSASAWAATTRSRPRRSTASTPRSRSTAWSARPRRGSGPGHRIEPLDGRRRDGADARVSSVPNDPWTPAADIDALRTAWSGRTDCEIVVVEGAEHGFVHDPDRDVHRADDAAATPGSGRSSGSAQADEVAATAASRAKGEAQASELAGVRLVSQSRAQRAAQTSLRPDQTVARISSSSRLTMR